MGGAAPLGPVQDVATPTAPAPEAPAPAPGALDTAAQGTPAPAETALVQAGTVDDATTLDITDPSTVLPIAGIAALFGLVILPLVERIARWTFPRASLSTGPSFTLRDIVAVGLALFGMQIVVGVIVDLMQLDVASLHVALPFTVVWQGATGVFVLALAARRRYGFAALGLRKGEHTWAVGYGLTRYCGWGPFLFALMALTPMLLERVFGLSHETQDVAQMIAGADGLERLLVPLFAVLLIPLFEELIFRGFLQNALEPRIGAWPAVVLSSLAFALMHGVSAAIPIFGLSLILGMIMLRTRRLSACWFVHGLHNGLTTALLFVAPETLLEQAR